MAEYFDREAAIVDFERCNHENPVWTPQRVKTLLMRIPAADVKTVKHGRWNIQDGTKTRRVCSVCGFDGPEYVKFYGYCPNCGAKMDGGTYNVADRNV